MRPDWEICYRLGNFLAQTWGTSGVAGALTGSLTRLRIRMQARSSVPATIGNFLNFRRVGHTSPLRNPQRAAGRVNQPLL